MPKPADRYVSHTSTLGLTAGHEEAYRSLERILHDGGRFKLILLQFNDPTYRDALIAKINAAATNPAVLHVSVETFPEFTGLETRLTELARDHAVIHLTGLENWLFPHDAPTRVTGFNYHRETIAENCPAALLLWLTEPDIRDFAVQAPDMWAWRAGVLDFSVVQRVDEILSYLDRAPDIAAGLKASLLHELGQLLHTTAEALECFESALALYRKDNNRLGEATTLSNIALVNLHLGKPAEALDAYRQSLAICREADILAAKGGNIWHVGQQLFAANQEQTLRIGCDLKDPQYEKDLAWFNQQFPPTDPNAPA